MRVAVAGGIEEVPAEGLGGFLADVLGDRCLVDHTEQFVEHIAEGLAESLLVDYTAGDNLAAQRRERRKTELEADHMVEEGLVDSHEVAH